MEVLSGLRDCWTGTCALSPSDGAVLALLTTLAACDTVRNTHVVWQDKSSKKVRGHLRRLPWVARMLEWGMRLVVLSWCGFCCAKSACGMRYLRHVIQCITLMWFGRTSHRRRSEGASDAFGRLHECLNGAVSYTHLTLPTICSV